MNTFNKAEKKLLEKQDTEDMAVEGSPRVTVVIVNFNCGRLLCDTVSAVLESTVRIELFIVDNASSDESMSLLRARHGRNKRIHVIENNKNAGFTKASNLAIKKASGQYILLLNPDCVVRPDTLERMLAVLAQHPEAGMAGCLIRNADGTEQAGCRRGIPTPWRTLVRVLHLNKLFTQHPRFRSFNLSTEPLPEEPVFHEAISGAFMLVKREAIAGVGLLDEGYFLHCDDVDWCMRFRQAGWKILFVPDVAVVHYKGVCSKSRPVRVLWHKHKGMARFYRKFFRHQYPLPLMALVLCAIWLRFSILSVCELVIRTKRLSSRGGRHGIMHHDSEKTQNERNDNIISISPPSEVRPLATGRATTAASRPYGSVKEGAKRVSIR